MFPDFPVYAADSVEEVLRHLRGEEILPLASSLPVSAEPEAPCPDFADVKGQPVARRAAEVAAPADTTCSCWGRRVRARA